MVDCWMVDLWMVSDGGVKCLIGPASLVKPERRRKAVGVDKGSWKVHCCKTENDMEGQRGGTRGVRV